MAQNFCFKFLFVIHYWFLTFLLIPVFSVTAFTQVPQGMNYQCALRDANGDVMVNEAVNIRFTIRQSFADNFANGPVRYQELHNTMTNEFGLVNLEISSGTVTQFAWSNIIWGEYDYVLQVELDAGSGYVDMGTSDFKSVPFAYLSNKAVNMNMGDLNDVETFMGVSEGDVLRFNSDEGWWEPQAFPSIADGVWGSDATNTWRIGGNVGIGTSTPQNGLHLHNKQGLRLTTAYTGSTFLDGFYIGQDSDNNNIYLSNFENGPIIFQTNFAERMRITETGLIGIGTSTPLTGLELHNKNGIRFTKTFTGTSLLDGFFIGQDAFNNGNVFFTNMENADMVFSTNLAERMRIGSSGILVNGIFTSDIVNTTELVSTSVAVNTLSSVDAELTNVTSENVVVEGYTQLGAGSSGIRTQVIVHFGSSDPQTYNLLQYPDRIVSITAIATYVNPETDEHILIPINDFQHSFFATDLTITIEELSSMKIFIVYYNF